MNVIKEIKKQIHDNPILIYMKGSPDSPSCGFSAKAVEAISSCGVYFAYVDVLENEHIRSALPEYAKWPTFPQLWVKGELIGGCDIILNMHHSGELKILLNKSIIK
ncbi:Grx4 family monothiol glutaredoxin [Buchnera aphidicola]|uniref:Grx4 family monothiol glutaredoxin n=1 Tax=Buchnera aphidicola TaxID=9 RepID=UPI0031B7F3B2